MSDDIDYQAWAVDLIGLLDAIESALNDGCGGDLYKVDTLLRERFEITEKHGLKVVFEGATSGTTQ